MNKRDILILAVIVTLFIVAGCGGAKSYYAKNPTTAEEVARVWGKCDNVEKLSDNTEKWVYDAPNTDPVARYYIIEDGRVVDGGVQ